MFYSYLKTALRNLFKTKLSSFINVTGLSIGLSCCLLISLYIIEEFRYDRLFNNIDRLYRVISHYNGSNNNTVTIETPAALATELGNGFAEIEAVTRMLKTDKGFFFAGDEAFQENIIFVDSAFVNVFDVEIIAGSRRSSLAKTKSMIISESIAVKIYGKEWKEHNIIGETLRIDDKFEYTISAVFKDLPNESHFHSNIFATDSPDLFSDARKVYTYIRLKEKSSVDQLSVKIGKAFSNRNWFIREKYKSFAIQPVGDIHLYSTLKEESDNHGTITNVYAFGLIAIFLLVICSVNFINLYIANASTRTKEVSIRKTLGGSKRELFLQFLLEPVIITAFAMVLSVLMVYLILPKFNEVLHKSLSFSSIASGWGVLIIVTVTLLIGLVTGVYPAAFLAFTNTAAAARKKVRGSVSAWFQHGLMVTQFVLSGAMMVLTIVAFQQVNLIQNRDPGYEKDKVLVLQNINMLGGLPEMMSFKNELLRIDGVENASLSGYTPSQNLWGRVRATFTGRDAAGVESIPATWLIVDNNFLPTLAMELREGLNFTEQADLERESVLINETAARQFHLNADGGALNKEISFVSEDSKETKTYRVKGIVKDFNFGSLHEHIKPMIMTFGFHRYEIIVRLSSRDPRDVVSEIAQLWKRSQPRVAISYNFLSDRYNKTHEADVSVGKLFSIFSLLNIFVACLGLFGLVSYCTMQRTKEIGIRKVLGASGWSIVTIMSEKFVILITVAFLLSLPLAWTLTTQWLNSFAFKVPISLGAFVITGVVIFSVPLATVAYITSRAARVNPIDSLKYE